MRRAHCDCCGTGADAAAIDVLLVAGWTLTEGGRDERLVLLCPLCTWQRSRACEAVKGAVEAAGPPAPGSGGVAGHSRSKGWWFWA